jgi:hypothetical protein
MIWQNDVNIFDLFEAGAGLLVEDSGFAGGLKHGKKSKKCKQQRAYI